MTSPPEAEPTATPPAAEEQEPDESQRRPFGADP